MGFTYKHPSRFTKNLQGQSERFSKDLENYKAPISKDIILQYYDPQGPEEIS